MKRLGKFGSLLVALALWSSGFTFAQNPPATVTLTPSDFTYLGGCALKVKHFGAGSLAYRAETDTWFTIDQTGQFPFDLLEVKLPEPDATNPASTLVKDWGAIDPTDKLHMAHAPLNGLKGLTWDPLRKCLWASYGGYYADYPTTDPFLIKIDLSGPTLAWTGPWGCTDNVGRAKSWIQLAPPSVQAKTGLRFLAGATNQGGNPVQSNGGPGLLALEEPTQAGQLLQAKKLLYWPLVPFHFAGEPAPIWGSNFPRYPADNLNTKHIFGNANVVLDPPPGTQPTYSYQNNIIHSFMDFPGGFPRLLYGSDVWYHSLWIETPSGKSGLFCPGQFSVGYIWYGNGHKCHADDSPAGIQFNNNLDSLLFPGKKCFVNSVTRGRQAESHVFRFALFSTDSILNWNTTSAPPTKIGNLATLGGTLPLETDPAFMFIADLHMGQMVYRSDLKRLYLLQPRNRTVQGPLVHVWTVN